MNSQDLPVPHGAPLRVRVPRQLGYKSVKSFSHITVVRYDEAYWPRTGRLKSELGYSWWAGI